MLQKIIQVGNSLAVTIPRSFIEQAKWKVGQKVMVLEETDPEMLTIQPQQVISTKAGLTPEFLKWLKKFNAKHKDVLATLAKK